jgi:hypothetical protein
MFIAPSLPIRLDIIAASIRGRVTSARAMISGAQVVIGISAFFLNSAEDWPVKSPMVRQGIISSVVPDENT